MLDVEILPGERFLARTPYLQLVSGLLEPLLRQTECLDPTLLSHKGATDMEHIAKAIRLKAKVSDQESKA
jgi:hypothetical protein